MLSSKSRSVSLTHISLLLVGLMWVLPFLNSRHAYPLTTFYQEWWSALLGVLAMGILTGRDYWRANQVPRIALMPVLLIAIATLQWCMGMVPYFDQVLLYILYFLFATMLMLLGARLSELFGLEKVAVTLATFLLAGAELSAMAGILQQYHWHTPFDSVVAMKVSASVYGNIAQPNHFANYIALGIVSLGLLLQQNRLNRVVTALLSVPLLFVLALSGSRSAWLYLLAMSASAWWLSRKCAELSVLLRYCLLLAAGFVAINLLLQLSLVTGADRAINTLQRLMGANETGAVRLYLWQEAIRMFINSPWLGNGLGQFAWQHFQLLPELRPHGVEGLYNNAHNILFQLAAEAGIAGLLAIGITLGSWFTGLRKELAIDSINSRNGEGSAGSPRLAAYWWGLSSLGVLGIHSLLEYPLWYIYFLAIAAILLGAMDRTRYSLELAHVGRLSATAVLLMAIAILVQFRVGYRQLEQVLASRSLTDPDPHIQNVLREKMSSIHDSTLLSPYAELFMGSLIEINGDHLADKLEANGRVLHFMPIGSVSYRQSLLLAQGGNMEKAKIALTRAIWSYPNEYPQWCQRIAKMAEKDPAHFSALLKFASQSEQEYRSAVHKP
ncbi:MAG: Wzy polymerase domain-containing protein [Gallionella sp.]